ncbi:MAG: FkbM family methyltransferase [Candidatus Omnitrophica bacterium]|nr:FkbM family methyltransferase [Candidatus Omnitrophota bacterium]
MQFRVSIFTQLMAIYSDVERWHQKRFREILKEGDVVIDVGANWGVHTLYFSRIVGNQGKVIAIEPYNLAFEELKWHLQKNYCKNVITLNIAVGDTDGEGIILSKPHHPHGILFEYIKENLSSYKGNKILIKTLDSLIRELKLEKVSLIKIDTEGAEAKILKGAEQTVRNFRPYFIVDLHTPEEDLSVGKWFSERGYHLQRINENLPPILNIEKGWPEKNGVWGSILAIPKKITLS